MLKTQTHRDMATHNQVTITPFICFLFCSPFFMNDIAVFLILSTGHGKCVITSFSLSTTPPPHPLPSQSDQPINPVNEISQALGIDPFFSIHYYCSDVHFHGFLFNATSPNASLCLLHSLCSVGHLYYLCCVANYPKT